MKPESVSPVEQRVLVLAPTARDAQLTAATYERAGIACRVCASLADVLRELEIGAAVLLISEEAVRHDEAHEVILWLLGQPPWSDLPVLLLARPGADSPAVAEGIERLGNVTVLERPLRVASLVSATRTAIRARHRQYLTRKHLVERARDEAALRASDRRKDEFLATLAHELRNPLAPIRNSLYILELAAQSDPKLRDTCEMLNRQVHHLVRLVDDLLEVSRISQGKIELRKETIDLVTVLRTAEEATRPLIDSRGHQLFVACEEGLTLVADPVRLAQVLENLVNNAAKYSEPGGKIWIAAERDRDQVRISVRDNGAGIPPGMLEKVFDMFAQGEERSPRAQGGLGIGLTLVKRLVEMHDGTVVAESEGMGKGSQFTVTLPIGNAVPVVPKEPTVQSRPAGTRIMVVDDNKDAADTLAFLLQSLGCEVRVVYSGAAALELLPEYQPGAVLLDIGMPEMDGTEVARRIRKLPECSDVTLIALTGWGQDQDLRRTREAGFDHHLTKPADVGTLETLLFGAVRT